MKFIIKKCPFCKKGIAFIAPQENVFKLFCGSCFNAIFHQAKSLEEALVFFSNLEINHMDCLSMEQLVARDNQPVYCVSFSNPQDNGWGLLNLKSRDAYVLSIKNGVQTYFYLNTYGRKWIAFNSEQASKGVLRTDKK